MVITGTSILLEEYLIFYNVTATGGMLDCLRCNTALDKSLDSISVKVMGLLSNIPIKTNHISNNITSINISLR